MNVKQLNAAGYTNTVGTPSKLNAQKSSGQTATEAKSMQVALSAGSQSLSGADNDVDMDKVNAIREALANGTLKINPERIAQGLIDSAKDLI